MEDFVVEFVSGGSHHTAFLLSRGFRHNFVCFGVGSIVVVWSWRTHTFWHLKPEPLVGPGSVKAAVEESVTSLALSPDDLYLVSSHRCDRPFLVLWDVSGLRVGEPCVELCRASVPDSNSNPLAGSATPDPPDFAQLQFDASGRLLFSLHFPADPGADTAVPSAGRQLRGYGAAAGLAGASRVGLGSGVGLGEGPVRLCVWEWSNGMTLLRVVHLNGSPSAGIAVARGASALYHSAGRAGSALEASHGGGGGGHGVEAGCEQLCPSVWYQPFRGATQWQRLHMRVVCAPSHNSVVVMSYSRLTWWTFTTDVLSHQWILSPGATYQLSSGAFVDVATVTHPQFKASARPAPGTTPACVYALAANPPRVLCISNAGRLLGQLAEPALGPVGALTCLAVMPEAVWVGTASGDVLDVHPQSLKVRRRLPYQRAPRARVKPVAAGAPLWQQAERAPETAAERYRKRMAFKGSRDNAIEEDRPGTLQWDSPGIGWEVMALTCSPNGRVLCIRYAEGTQILLDLKADKAVGSTLSHFGSVRGVAWHPKATGPHVLASVSTDQSMLLWQFDGERPPAPRGGVGVAFGETASSVSFAAASSVTFGDTRGRESAGGGAEPMGTRSIGCWKGQPRCAFDIPATLSSALSYSQPTPTAVGLARSTRAPHVKAKDNDAGVSMTSGRSARSRGYETAGVGLDPLMGLGGGGAGRLVARATGVDAAGSITTTRDQLRSMAALSVLREPQAPASSATLGRGDSDDEAPALPPPALPLPLVASVQVTAVAFHPVGTVIVCGCNHGLLRVFSASSGELLQLLDPLDPSPASVAAGIGADDGSAARVHLLDRGPARDAIGKEVTHITFSSSGQYLVSSHRSGQVAVIRSSAYAGKVVLQPAAFGGDGAAMTRSNGPFGSPLDQEDGGVGSEASTAEPGAGAHRSLLHLPAGALCASVWEDASRAAEDLDEVTSPQQSSFSGTVRDSGAAYVAKCDSGSVIALYRVSDARSGGPRDRSSDNGFRMYALGAGLAATGLGAVGDKAGDAIIAPTRLPSGSSRVDSDRSDPQGATELFAWRVRKFCLTSTCVCWTVHPSRSYVIATVADGTIFIYHVWLGELRGVIPTLPPRVRGLHAAGSVTGLRGPYPGGEWIRGPTSPVELLAGCCTVDPSGLYVAVATVAVRWLATTEDEDEPTPRELDEARREATGRAGPAIPAGTAGLGRSNHRGDAGQHEREPISRVAVYETCTGRFVGSVGGLPDIRSLSFSPVEAASPGAAADATGEAGGDPNTSDEGGSSKRPWRRPHEQSRALRIAVGCADGALVIIRCPRHTRRNVADAMAAGASTKEFWDAQPIFIDPLPMDSLSPASEGDDDDIAAAADKALLDLSVDSAPIFLPAESSGPPMRQSRSRGGNRSGQALSRSLRRSDGGGLRPGRKSGRRAGERRVSGSESGDDGFDAWFDRVSAAAQASVKATGPSHARRRRKPRPRRGSPSPHPSDDGEVDLHARRERRQRRTRDGPVASHRPVDRHGDSKVDGVSSVAGLSGTAPLLGVPASRGPGQRDAAAIGHDSAPRSLPGRVSQHPSVARPARAAQSVGARARAEPVGIDSSRLGDGKRTGVQVDPSMELDFSRLAGSDRRTAPSRSSSSRAASSSRRSSRSSKRRSPGSLGSRRDAGEPDRRADAHISSDSDEGDGARDGAHSSRRGTKSTSESHRSGSHRSGSHRSGSHRSGSQRSGSRHSGSHPASRGSSPHSSKRGTEDAGEDDRRDGRASRSSLRRDSSGEVDAVARNGGSNPASLRKGSRSSSRDIEQRSVGSRSKGSRSSRRDREQRLEGSQGQERSEPGGDADSAGERGPAESGASDSQAGSNGSRKDRKSSRGSSNAAESDGSGSHGVASPINAATIEPADRVSNGSDGEAASHGARSARSSRSLGSQHSGASKSRRGSGSGSSRDGKGHHKAGAAGEAAGPADAGHIDADTATRHVGAADQSEGVSDGDGDDVGSGNGGSSSGGATPRRPDSEIGAAVEDAGRTVNTADAGPSEMAVEPHSASETSDREARRSATSKDGARPSSAIGPRPDSSGMSRPVTAGTSRSRSSASQRSARRSPSPGGMRLPGRDPRNRRPY